MTQVLSRILTDWLSRVAENQRVRVDSGQEDVLISS